jgi:PAS domain S-box-containing protein
VLGGESFSEIQRQPNVDRYYEFNWNPVLQGKNTVGLAVFVRDITERKRAEQDLQDSEEKYRTLVENAFESILIAQDGMLKFVNRKASEISGFSEQELRALPFLEFVHQDDRAMVSEHYMSRLKGDVSVPPYMFRLMNKDGSVRWVQINAVLVTWDGRPATLNFLSDITGHKRAEEALRASEAEFRSLAESMPQIVWITRPDGWNVYFNQQWLVYTGLTLEESYGHGWNTPFHPDDRQRAWEAWQNATQHGAIYSLECRLRRADGAYRWWLIRGVPLRDAAGGILKWFGTCTDIDNLKQAADALKKSEAGLAEAQRIAHIGNWERDFVTGELRWSDEIYRIFGFEDPGLKISFDIFLNAVHPDEREYLQKAMKEALSADNPYDFDHRIVLPSGEIRSVHEQGVAHFDESGKAIRMVGTVQDITERVQAKSKLQEALDRLRKAFGGIIQVLSATTEMRDPYTAGHQRRSADLARAIGREMGLPDDQVEGLRLAGTIHDIGKIGIPADILSKPTRLSEIEFSLIQSHSQIGFDILAGVEFAWPIAKIVHQHHERMDGSGYPQRLKGDDILLESRILAVSDVIEAMASHRPYRPALGIEAALREIEKGRGVLYDSAVVEACLRLFREKAYTLKD